MQHEYSLAHLTALSLKPPALIDAAADAGYRYVGLRLNRTTPEEDLYDLINDAALMRETKARLKDRGVEVWDIEVARMDPERDAPHYRDFLEAGAELGARHVITQLPDPDRQRAIARFAELCDMARPLGLTLDLEFVSWTEVPSLEAAADILRQAKRSNAGILVDMLHFDRSNSSKTLLRSLPREWFTWAHVCDAPGEHPTTREGLVHHARRARLFPGDGGIDVKGILACLPDSLVYGLEIPNEALAAGIGYPAYAGRALKAARAWLDA